MFGASGHHDWQLHESGNLHLIDVADIIPFVLTRADIDIAFVRHKHPDAWGGYGFLFRHQFDPLAIINRLDILPVVRRADGGRQLNPVGCAGVTAITGAVDRKRHGRSIHAKVDLVVDMEEVSAGIAGVQADPALIAEGATVSRPGAGCHHVLIAGLQVTAICRTEFPIGNLINMVGAVHMHRRNCRLEIPMIKGFDIIGKRRHAVDGAVVAIVNDHGAAGEITLQIRCVVALFRLEIERHSIDLRRCTFIGKQSQRSRVSRAGVIEPSAIPQQRVTQYLAPESGVA